MTASRKSIGDIGTGLGVSGIPGRPLGGEAPRINWDPPMVVLRNHDTEDSVFVDVRDAWVSEAAGVAIERLYREEGGRLWRAVLFYCGDREIASDAVAEAFARALRYEDEIRDVRAWVWRTAFREATRELRRSRRFLTFERDSPYEIPEAPALLSTVLPRLSPKQRGSVVLHYYCGYPLREAAAILGSTPAGVAVHLHRARARLKELIGGRDED
jgi:RNA polymerase sigma-70 factor, ECF subfamily